MIPALQPLTHILNNPTFRFFIIALSFTCKLSILFLCIKHAQKSSGSRLLLFLFALFLGFSIFEDGSHLISRYVRNFLLKGVRTSVPQIVFLSRMDWMFFITQYQAMALFLECLCTKKVKWRSFLNIFTFIVNIVLSSGFIFIAYFYYYPPPPGDSRNFMIFYEVKLTELCYAYLPFLFAPKFYLIYKKIQTKELPVILTYQVRYLISFLVPYLILETINSRNSYLGRPFSRIFSNATDFIFPLATIVCTYAIFFMGKKMMGLRFLNIKKNVESHEKFNFLSKFKDILEQLNYATALKELAHLTQTFFQSAFSIPLGRTRLYIRKEDSEKVDFSNYDIINTIEKVEQFIEQQQNQEILQELKSSKIFIRDEMHFSYFYEEDPYNKKILEFLDSINADIFLPIYERNTITSYVIVEQHSRPHTLFTNKERDEMLVFTSYLNNIINILKNSNVEILRRRHKLTTEELYLKHQENNQYKESIRSFMRSNKDRKIGIIFYKNRRFSIANEAAQELVSIDINTALGHPLAQAFRTVAQRVQGYKVSQSTMTRDVNGQRVVIAGVPSIEENVTILLIYYPEISDIIKTQFDQLKDPSTWDYLLYLETTQSGQLINQLIPSNNEKLLTFKINLLATALSKKATLLQIPVDDLIPTVELLHAISLRQTLHILKLSEPEKNNEAMIALCGLNPLMQKEEVPALLEKLDSIGTLFIENIEYLSLETQDALAHYISHGFFHKFKSEHKVFSNVRIICSTHKDLLALSYKGAFSKALFNELQGTSLTMPSFDSFTKTEIEQVAQEYADQITTTETYKNLLILTEKDKMQLNTERPVSLWEFKEKVHHLLALKSAKNNLTEITEFNAAYNISDPEIAQAVRLGRKALKDPQVMALLWDKLKNQNKIATLLGVNRSSVNRRCIEYDLK